MARTVPVTGVAIPGNYETAAFWNAQVKATADFLLNPPMFSAYHSGTQSVAYNTFVIMLLDTELIDTDGGHSTTANSQRYVCQVPGVYQLTGCTVWPSSATSSTGVRGSKFVVNGTTDVPGSENLVAPAMVATIAPANPSVVRLAAGDYVSIAGFQNASSPNAQSTVVVGAAATSFACQWVSA